MRRRCLYLYPQMIRVFVGNNLPIDKLVNKLGFRSDRSGGNRLDNLILSQFLGSLRRQIGSRGHKRLHLERKRLGYRIVTLLKPGQKPFKRRNVVLFYQYFCKRNESFLPIFMSAKLLIRDNEKFKSDAILRHKLEHLLEICHAFGKSRIKFRFFCRFICHIKII